MQWVRIESNFKRIFHCEFIHSLNSFQSFLLRIFSFSTNSQKILFAFISECDTTNLHNLEPINYPCNLVAFRHESKTDAFFFSSSPPNQTKLVCVCTKNENKTINMMIEIETVAFMHVINFFVCVQK